MALCDFSPLEGAAEHSVENQKPWRARKMSNNDIRYRMKQIETVKKQKEEKKKIFVTFFGGMLTLKMKVVNRDLSRYVHFTKYSIACTSNVPETRQPSSLQEVCHIHLVLCVLYKRNRYIYFFKKGKLKQNTQGHDIELRRHVLKGSCWVSPATSWLNFGCKVKKKNHGKSHWQLERGGEG